MDALPVTPAPYPLFSRDGSWLTFNERILNLAADPRVPLYERIRFLSIYSSNLDEFFRVRIPALMAVNKVLHTAPVIDETLTPGTLDDILQQVSVQQEAYGHILTTQLLPALNKEGVHVYYKEELLPVHLEFIRNYFRTRVLSYLQPVWLQGKAARQVFLENNALYLAVALASGEEEEFAIVNIPAVLPRFLELPNTGNMHHIVLLDDVIRQHMSYLFPQYRITGCYSIKITRDAEIDLDELKGDILEQIESGVKKRALGVPTRFLYDAAMPLYLKEMLAVFFALQEEEMMPGGRYHNLKDLADLPTPVKKPSFFYNKLPPVRVPRLDQEEHILDSILQRDILLHTPYQQYDYILRFFNEAAVDPDVEEIYVTFYRIAAASQIANALISAARNGKQVVAFVELKARFDETNNINWAKQLKAAGVKLVYSIPGMKVHAKVGLVKRRRGWKTDYIGLLSTGNLNETTARFYADHILLTAHNGMTQEMELLFIYLQSRKQPAEYKFLDFKYLLVARFNLTHRFTALIDREIAHAKAGRPAHITVKVNNLQEKAMIYKLYEASEAGVQVDLLVRSICCLVPDQPCSANIRVRRLVDRYLEHARVFVFHNNGQEDVFLGSADWMVRNLHRRIEVCFPVFSLAFKKQLIDILALQVADNTNAVRLDAQLHNLPILPLPGQPAVNAQTAIYAYTEGLSL
ncbi:polyphosphate kinase [Chitinophaga costaii]|uniref:Polyphosphate kinase n=1 Tax=Chitinophaga costaii TaxID=1335309 RepID=A0A1C4F2B2_9BACT|nr:polyphosphate kinase 1 [Chitinophaga costaii]PUZ22158.1 polyphosphate kinase 1 [Chitinophaga costaii]SCC49641.1 polyphosphate kinase [Chitinophaga costaii]